MHPDDIASLAADSGFADIGAELAALARPSLRLLASEDDARIGASRLGGTPDLPADIGWPTPAWSQTPMGFIAQIALDVLDDTIWPGPHDGLLAFFCARSPEHGAVEGPGAALVLHIPAEATLERRERPTGLAPELVLRPLSVDARPELTTPGIGADVAHALIELGFGWDGGSRVDQHEDYIEFQHRLAEAQGFARHTPDGRWAAQHRLLGWPRQVQADVFDDFAYMSLRAQGAPHGLKDVADRAGEWRLLLQVESDTRLGTDFADAGSLYFGVPARDLAGGRFDAVQATLQSA